LAILAFAVAFVACHNSCVINTGGFPVVKRNDRLRNEGVFVNAPTSAGKGEKEYRTTTYHVPVDGRNTAAWVRPTPR
jgi:hypothetical protein